MRYFSCSLLLLNCISFCMEIELPTIQHLIKAIKQNDPVVTQQIISANPDLVNQKFVDIYEPQYETNFITPLHIAKKECAQVLLKNSAKINEGTSVMRETPLDFVFLRHNNFNQSLAFYLFKSGADINNVDCHGNNILHRLLVMTNKAIPSTAIQFLLEHGIDISRRNRNGQTPLDIAIINRSQHLPAFEKRGIMFFYKDRNPLCDPRMLLKDDAYIFRFRTYPDDDFPTRADERTKMECDLARLFIFVQKWTHKRRYNVSYLDSPSTYGITASKYGYCFTRTLFEELNEWVDENGVKRIKKHFDNRCEKAYKILQTNPDLFLEILNIYPYIINYNFTQQQDMFDYMTRTMKKEEHISFIKDIVRHLDDIDRSLDMPPLLYCAVKNNNPLFVKVLIDHGVNFAHKHVGRTALSLAKNMKFHECVESFYTALGKRLYIIGKYGANRNKIKEFLSQGCDLHTKNKRGDTLLSMLCEYFLCSSYWCKVLLKLGACVNVKNNAGESPLYKAVFQSGKKTVKLFLEHGAIVTKATLQKASTPSMKNILETAYNEQQCLICYENPETLGEIPCDNKHKGSFLCQECYNALEKCPFRCGKLHDFNAM